MSESNFEIRPHHGLMASCRAGFEKELAAELDDVLQTQGVSGFVQTHPNSGLVIFEILAESHPGTLPQKLNDTTLIFARQLCFTFARVTQLPTVNRAAPLLLALKHTALRFRCLRLETPDEDVAKQQSGFCKRFQKPFETLLQKAKRLDPAYSKGCTLHVLFDSANSAWLGYTLPHRSHVWPMGIPRLRMPSQAPSRSTLKLAEAFQVLLSPEELEKTIRPGARAVDLGAAPGGWTWQLVQKGLRVTALDNGPMAPSVMATEMVDHVRADGFTWKPARPVDWMVCDMVEQPTRIALLAADWVALKRCRHTIFNLKLPMKSRLNTVRACEELIAKRLKNVAPYVLRIKHLYHDREEVTCYLHLQD